MEPAPTFEIVEVHPRHVKTMRIPPLFRRPRWALAGLLWDAVQTELRRAHDNAPVKVLGPGGATKVMTRARAELLVRRGKLRRDDIDTARAELGLPPRIGVTADTDHTHLAGADAAEEPTS